VEQDKGLYSTDLKDKEDDMSKSAWYNPFSWGAKDPQIMTKEIVDPKKEAVASPMSEYLSGQVGKGLPRYPGQLSEEFDPQAHNRYKEFLSLDAGAWFDKAVGDPEMKRFKEDIIESAEIQIKYEGYISRERTMAEKIGRLEKIKLSKDLNYDRFKSISTEARQKLNKHKPDSIGQASRISGVSPSDISVLLVYLGR